MTYEVIKDGDPNIKVRIGISMIISLLVLTDPEVSLLMLLY